MQTTMPLSNFSFLIDNKLAGSARPGDYGDDLLEDLEEARSHGIGAVVSLTESPLDRKIVGKLGLQYLHLPVEDYTPPTLMQMKEFCEFVEAETSREGPGNAVLVHCRAGIGRTGTMLAAYLVHCGMDADDAIKHVRSHRRGSIETRSQENSIRNFAKSLKS